MEEREPIYNKVPNPINRNLRAELETSSDLIGTLDNASLQEVTALLSPEINQAIDMTLANAHKFRKSTILLDSDGTAFLTIDTGREQDNTEFYDQMTSEGRVFPGKAIQGEVPQDYTRSYKVSPDMVKVWSRLSKQNISVGIFSGRKEDDLKNNYKLALESVDGFSIYPSKGRAIVTQEGTTLIPSLAERLAGNPLKKVADEMHQKVLGITPSDKRAVAETLDYSNPKSGYEQLTGYRISTQSVDGNVVLVRLHHRYRACELAKEAGASVPNVENPGKIKGDELSKWLLSEETTAQQVLSQLENENEKIMQAWNTLSTEAITHLQITTKDHVGHRSLCQDQAPELDLSEALNGIEDIKGVIVLYAGDNYTETGNDRPTMNALYQRDANATTIMAISKDRQTTGKESWMVSADQFDLFLMQYAIARTLEEKQTQAT